jgi:hypothetical protein
MRSSVYSSAPCSDGAAKPYLESGRLRAGTRPSTSIGRASGQGAKIPNTAGNIYAGQRLKGRAHNLSIQASGRRETPFLQPARPRGPRYNERRARAGDSGLQEFLAAWGPGVGRGHVYRDDSGSCPNARRAQDNDDRIVDSPFYARRRGRWGDRADGSRAGHFEDRFGVSRQGCNLHRNGKKLTISQAAKLNAGACHNEALSGFRRHAQPLIMAASLKPRGLWSSLRHVENRFRSVGAV